MRKNIRENPGKPIDKKNFALKLHNTFIAYHKSSIVIEASKGSGIYFVRRYAISDDKFKPSHTLTDAEEVHEIGVSTVTGVDEKEGLTAASKDFQLYSYAIGTPSIQRYGRSLEEG